MSERENGDKLTYSCAVGCNWLCLTGVKCRFLFILSFSHVKHLSMGLHLRVMNQSFPKIHGVQESINTLKKPKCQNFHLICSFKISSNVMPSSCWVRSTWHALLYTKPNLSVWWFSMPKGFRIGQDIRQIPGMSKLKGTFGHTVVVVLEYSRRLVIY